MRRGRTRRPLARLSFLVVHRNPVDDAATRGSLDSVRRGNTMMTLTHCQNMLHVDARRDVQRYRILDLTLPQFLVHARAAVADPALLLALLFLVLPHGVQPSPPVPLAVWRGGDGLLD